MFAQLVSDIIPDWSRVVGGEMTFPRGKGLLYSLQWFLLSVYTVIEMFHKPLPLHTLPLSTVSHSPVCSFLSLFLILPPTSSSYPPLCCSPTCFISLTLPAEKRDSGTGAYLCGNHLLHLTSTHCRWIYRSGMSSILLRSLMFSSNAAFLPNQKDVQILYCISVLSSLGNRCGVRVTTVQRLYVWDIELRS